MNIRDTLELGFFVAVLVAFVACGYPVTRAAKK
jgi:hypothetical protein